MLLLMGRTQERHDALVKRDWTVYSSTTTRPMCSSHEDALWVVDASVSPSKPPQGGFAVSESE
jgi:hypothetical protein